MTDNVAHMIRAAVHNPLDETVIGALADALDESHPRNTDGRAAILRGWLEEGGGGGHGNGLRVWSGEGYHSEDHPNGTSITSTVTHRNYGPHFTVVLHTPKDPEQPQKITQRYLTFDPSHREALDIADNLPNAEEVHRILRTHFGPDPRPKQYTRDYSKLKGQQ